jgi:hypothetical protein
MEVILPQARETYEPPEQAGFPAGGGGGYTSPTAGL